jgi:seryl-tRNA synthetase
VLDEKRRSILASVEQMKNKQNLDSKEIPRLKKEGKDTTELMKEMKALSDEIKKLDAEVAAVEEELRSTLLNIPNTPSPKVPVGGGDADNVEIRKWGEPRVFDFEFKAHWDVGTDLDILDFERAAKISGTRFTVYKGLGARLERAVVNFMLDLHTKEHGYTEILPPFMVNRDAMTGTGQLPKFEEDMFWIPAKGFLPGADRRGPGDQPQNERNHRREELRFIIPPTRHASERKRVPQEGTPEALSDSTSSTRSSS